MKGTRCAAADGKGRVGRERLMRRAASLEKTPALGKTEAGGEGGARG